MLQQRLAEDSDNDSEHSHQEEDPESTFYARQSKINNRSTAIAIGTVKEDQLTHPSVSANSNQQAAGGASGGGNNPSTANHPTQQQKESSSSTTTTTTSSSNAALWFNGRDLPFASIHIGVAAADEEQESSAASAAPLEEHSFLTIKSTPKKSAANGGGRTDSLMVVVEDLLLPSRVAAGEELEKKLQQKQDAAAAAANNNNNKSSSNNKSAPQSQQDSSSNNNTPISPNNNNNNNTAGAAAMMGSPVASSSSGGGGGGGAGASGVAAVVGGLEPFGPSATGIVPPTAIVDHADLLNNLGSPSSGSGIGSIGTNNSSSSLVANVVGAPADAFGIFGRGGGGGGGVTTAAAAAQQQQQPPPLGGAAAGGGDLFSFNTLMSGICDFMGETDATKLTTAVNGGGGGGGGADSGSIDKSIGDAAAAAFSDPTLLLNNNNNNAIHNDEIPPQQQQQRKTIVEQKLCALALHFDSDTSSPNFRGCADLVGLATMGECVVAPSNNNAPSSSVHENGNKPNHHADPVLGGKKSSGNKNKQNQQQQQHQSTMPLDDMNRQQQEIMSESKNRIDPNETLVLVSPTNPQAYDYYAQRGTYGLQKLQLDWRALTADHISKLFNADAEFEAEAVSDHSNPQTASGCYTSYPGEVLAVLKELKKMKHGRMPGSFDEFVALVDDKMREQHHAPQQRALWTNRARAVRDFVFQPRSGVAPPFDFLNEVRSKGRRFFIADLTDPMLGTNDARNIFYILLNQFRGLDLDSINNFVLSSNNSQNMNNNNNHHQTQQQQQQHSSSSSSTTTATYNNNNTVTLLNGKLVIFHDVHKYLVPPTFGGAVLPSSSSSTTAAPPPAVVAAAPATVAASATTATGGAPTLGSAWGKPPAVVAAASTPAPPTVASAAPVVVSGPKSYAAAAQKHNPRYVPLLPPLAREMENLVDARFRENTRVIFSTQNPGAIPKKVWQLVESIFVHRFQSVEDWHFLRTQFPFNESAFHEEVLMFKKAGQCLVGSVGVMQAKLEQLQEQAKAIEAVIAQQQQQRNQYHQHHNHHHNPSSQQYHNEKYLKFQREQLQEQITKLMDMPIVANLRARSTKPQVNPSPGAKAHRAAQQQQQQQELQKIQQQHQHQHQQQQQQQHHQPVVAAPSQQQHHGSFPTVATSAALFTNGNSSANDNGGGDYSTPSTIPSPTEPIIAKKVGGGGGGPAAAAAAASATTSHHQQHNTNSAVAAAAPTHPQRMSLIDTLLLRIYQRAHHLSAPRSYPGKDVDVLGIDSDFKKIKWHHPYFAKHCCRDADSYRDVQTVVKEMLRQDLVAQPTKPTILHLTASGITYIENKLGVPQPLLVRLATEDTKTFPIDDVLDVLAQRVVGFVPSADQQQDEQDLPLEEEEEEEEYYDDDDEEEEEEYDDDDEEELERVDTLVDIVENLSLDATGSRYRQVRRTKVGVVVKEKMGRPDPFAFKNLCLRAVEEGYVEVGGQGGTSWIRVVPPDGEEDDDDDDDDDEDDTSDDDYNNQQHQNNKKGSTTTAVASSTSANKTTAAAQQHQNQQKHQHVADDNVNNAKPTRQQQKNTAAAAAANNSNLSDTKQLTALVKRLMDDSKYEYVLQSKLGVLVKREMPQLRAVGGLNTVVLKAHEEGLLELGGNSNNRWVRPVSGGGNGAAAAAGGGGGGSRENGTNIRPPAPASKQDTGAAGASSAAASGGGGVPAPRSQLAPAPRSQQATTSSSSASAAGGNNNNSSSLPPEVQTLLTIIKKLVHENESETVRRSLVADVVKRKIPNLDCSFKELTVRAEKLGLVTMGGSFGEAWIKLL